MFLKIVDTITLPITIKSMRTNRTKSVIESPVTLNKICHSFEFASIEALSVIKNSMTIKASTPNKSIANLNRGYLIFLFNTLSPFTHKFNSNIPIQHYAIIFFKNLYC